MGGKVGGRVGDGAPPLVLHNACPQPAQLSGWLACSSGCNKEHTLSSSSGLPCTRHRTSAAIGTVELTGLEMMASQARGQKRATPSTSVRTMPAGAWGSKGGWRPDGTSMCSRAVPVPCALQLTTCTGTQRRTERPTAPFILTSIDVEEVVPGHAWFARHARWDDHQVSAVQRIRQCIRPGVRRHAGRGGNV